MIDLPNVTLVLVDSRKGVKQTRSIIGALQSCCYRINYGDILLLNRERTNSATEYSEFIINDLPLKIETSHALIVQTDGFVYNDSNWNNDWLEYDYIGAPWLPDPNHRWPGYPNITPETRVGNGGFSLRSRNLMMEARQFALREPLPIELEDAYICRTLGPALQEKGYKFAPVEVAEKFSGENVMLKDQFGFHGKLTAEMNGIKL